MSWLEILLKKQKETSVIALDLLSKSLTFGLTLQEDIKGFVDNLKKKVEDQQGGGESVMDEIKTQASKKKEELVSNLSQISSKVFDMVNIPTREEVDNLSRKVQSLSAKLKKYENADSEGDD